MNNPSPRNELPDSNWVRLSLHLLAAALLLLTPILLARAQGANSSVVISNVLGGLVTNPADEDFLASLISGRNIAIVLGLVALVLFVLRRLQTNRIRTGISTDLETETPSHPIQSGEGTGVKATLNSLNCQDQLPRTPSATVAASERRGAVRQSEGALGSMFGAYRIDQEVGKLVLGQAHRMDVISSRAPEDRRAIRASLIKTISSQSSSDDQKFRAREALAEYGFVARESATLLMASDPFDRTSAARTLGEIGSPAALPFLLEALHDSESIVRNQAVISIGELKIPSAIGALLDLARKHPDVPPSLVSQALSACSVEGLNFLKVALSATTGSENDNDGPGPYDFVLEPRRPYQELPDQLTDVQLKEALKNVSSQITETRAQAIQSLSQFPARSSVSALGVVVLEDPEPHFRAQAVVSLATIDHESAFPHIVIAMADESREVRAAAARALSRLSFDRSEAYARLVQTADKEMLCRLAQACIKAGIVSQNIDRLATSDRRQAYKAFAIFSLLTKAGRAEPILEAIKSHRVKLVRVRAVHLLVSTRARLVLEQLQKLAAQENIDEEVKTAVLEAMYKLRQQRAAGESPVTEPVVEQAKGENDLKESANKTEVGFEFKMQTTVQD